MQVFKTCFSIILVLFSLHLFAQKNDLMFKDSFEKEKSLQNYDKSGTSELSLSETHRKFGKSSLKWSWSGDGAFSTTKFAHVSHANSPLKYGDHFPASPILVMSVYNEVAQNEKIKIAYAQDGKEQVWFYLPINYTGWRTIWVPFYEMNGNAPKKTESVTYDTFIVSAAESTRGTLYFDDIVFSQYQDDRHSYPDMLVPFIKRDKEVGADHWMPLMRDIKRIQNLEANPVSVAIRMDLMKFEKLIDADLTIAKRYKLYMNTLKTLYASLNLKDNGQTVVGPPLTFKEEQVYFDKKPQKGKDFNEVQDLGKVLKKLANFHDRANAVEQQEIESMFLSGTKYFLDQGWQSGSSGGTRHHIGYNVRELTEAFYVMRKVLRKEGLLNDVGSSLHWLFNLGMVLGDEKSFHVNIDYLNTQSYYHLMLIFLMDSQEKQATLLQAYSKYMSITLAQQNEEWGFKIDGTAWHHNGHYPAYGMGAFKTVPKVIRTLAGTRFRIRKEGHKNFKNAFLTTRGYSQLYDFGFGNAGRHPFESNNIKSLKEQYLLMANSGNPSGTSKIDKDVAAAYLRLWGKKDILNSSIFKDVNGINTEILKGYKTLPYGATAIHRRDNWAAIIKGYSKYVWASEIYVASNRYGRYPANGTIQLLNNKGEKGSGFQQEGWDWNRYPGGTIIYLPFEELEPDTPLIMYRSKESFVGATELDGNGVFGMILNESKGDNADGKAVKVGFPGKLKAKKSVFSFGDKLICIGTNISSVDEKNPTQTNLFQTFLKNTKTPMHTSSGMITKFPYEAELVQDKKSSKWLTDPYGNGYHILSDASVQIKKAQQNSYHNKYSIRTGAMDPKGNGAKETEGEFATGWINHGLAPNNASYQYVIYPFLNEESLKKFGDKAINDDSYTILRADSMAHIVSDKETNTTGYVVFEANENLKHGILNKVSEPSMVMLRQDDKDNITLSVVQPDLNFPEYKSGKYRNYSRPVELTIILKGKWQTGINDFVKSINNSETTTSITFVCKDGFSNKIKLQKL